MSPPLASRLFAAYVALRPKLGRGLGLGLHERAYRTARRLFDPKRVRVLGFELTLDPYDDVLSYNLARGYPWEEAETRLFRSLLRPGLQVVDVGAHIGYYTVLASLGVGPSGRVFAFEPAPRNLALLRQNVEANRCANVTIAGHAVGAERARATLRLDPRNSGGHSLVAAAGSTAAGTEVECVDLDSWLDERHARPELFKIDVEGAEGAVLDGMSRTLAREGPLTILIEIFPERLELAGRQPLDLLRLLASAGFSVSAIGHEAEALSLERIVDLARERRLINLVCTKR
jgi:FkbM family methyltransferase